MLSSVRTIGPLMRAVLIIGAVAALVTSITFAALNDSVTLTGNTLSSATADLNIWDGGAYSSTATGFTVTNLVPGTPSAQYAFYLQNNSIFAMDVTVQSTLPSVVGIANFSDIEVTFYNEDGTTTLLATTMDVLSASPQVLETLPAGATGDSSTATNGNYFVQFNIKPAGVSGSSASVGAFTFTFVGTQDL